MRRINRSIIIFAIIFVILIVIFIKFYMPEKETIPVRFFLSNKTGFDLSPNMLSFGKIMPNQSASRSITLENLQDQKVKIKIKSSRDISENLIVTENNFFLEPGESKTVTFVVFMDGLTEFREYDGSVTILTRKV